MKYVFNYLTLFSFFILSLENFIRQEQSKWHENITESLKQILLQFTNESCRTEIVNNIDKIYLYSDIDIISDFNKENECIELNFTYYLFYYKLSEKAFEKERNKTEILKFLNNNNFSTGICVPENCSYFIENLFNSNTLVNESIINFLNSSINTNTLYYIKNDKKQKNDNQQNFLLFIVFGSYISIRIIITIIGEIIFQREKDDLIKIISNQELEKEGEEKSGQSFTESSNDDINSENVLNNYEQKKNSKSNSSEELFEKTNISFVYEVKEKSGFFFYFNIFRNIGIYNSKTEMKWFRDENLELVNFFRALFLLLCVLDFQIYSTFKHPTRDFFNKQFYSSIGFILIKFCSFSNICYVTLDGFLLSFKFLNFYKHYCIEQKNKISQVFYKFLIMSIPKIILYYSNFYLVHYFLLDFINIIDLKAGQKYHFIDHNSIKCFSNEYKKYLFNYYSFLFNLLSNKFDDCNKIFFIYHNEFMMLLFFILLFCILLQFQSRLLESFILLIIFIPLIFYSILLINTIKDDDYYDRQFLSGEIYTFKYIYLFAGIYFIGILTGIGYFNYVDSISPSHVNEYIPFNYIGKLLSQFLFDISYLFKFIIIIFIMVCFFVLSSTYLFYCYLNSYQLNFKINGFLKFLYFYEKIIFVFLFNVLLLILLVMGENIFSKIGGLSLICLISRNGFTIFASYDYFIKIFYIFFEYQYCLSISDNILIAFGEFTFIILLSCLFNVLFELPFRMILIEYTKPAYSTNQISDKINKLVD